MTTVNRKSLPVGLFAALIAAAPGAHAANANAGSGETSFDEDQIESFVDAQSELQQIQQEYTSQIQQADESEVEQLQKEAQQEMASAVEDAGLKVKEYNRIAQASRNDQELANRIENASK